MNIEKLSSWFKFLIKKFGMNGLKGIYAEKVVSGYLRLFFPRSKLLSNVTLSYGNYTTQIDHILINENGVFVIEVKNYKGNITATQAYDKWMIRYSNHRNAKTFRINSPIHQNNTHCKAVASYLGLRHSEPVNVISFTTRANVRTAKGEYLPNVCVGKDLVAYIKSFTVPKFTSEQVEEFYQRLWANRLSPSLSTDYYHIENIKKMLVDIEEEKLEREQKKIRDVNAYVREQVRQQKINEVKKVLEPTD